MVMKPVGVILLLVCLVLPLAAQDDNPLSEPLSYDQPVGDTLTQVAFWDWWHIQAAAGDLIVAEMQAGPTLEPLLGIINDSGNLLARSEDGPAGGSVVLEYRVEEAGQYTVVATRVGNENGSSTGPYQLLVRQANPPRLNPYQEVTFRCQDVEAANAVTLMLRDDSLPGGPVIISAYGLDGFEPVLRAEFENFDLTDCSRDLQALPGNRYQLPGEAPVTLAEPVTGGAAQLTLTSLADLGQLTLTLGSIDSAPGRFLQVNYGLTIDADDRDSLQLCQGPLAAAAPMQLYMIAGEGIRLDPSLHLLDATAPEVICDDVGGRGCESGLTPDEVFIYLTEAQANIRPDRFDAGVTLLPGIPRLLELELSSYSDRTTGLYSLVMLGEIPARD
jgi:hypothetical protein